MTCLWSGGITARRCYALRCNASAGGRTGSPAGTCWRSPPRLSWGVRAAYSAWQRQTNGETAAASAEQTLMARLPVRVLRLGSVTWRRSGPSKRPRTPSCTRSTTVTFRPYGSPSGIPLGGLGLGAAENSRGTDCPPNYPPRFGTISRATPMLTDPAANHSRHHGGPRRCVHGDSTSQAEYAGSIPVIGSTVIGSTSTSIQR